MADIGIITYQLGDIRFGMYADRILEIIQFSGARAIPRPLPYIVGLTEHRKYLVTVVDFRKRLGLPSFELVSGITMIIAKISSGMIGLLVDALSHFKHVPETQILPPLSISGFPEHLLRGVLNEGEDILMIPDFDKIFSSYIPVKVLPITPAEKIAFQYRFTPGALTRTLEKTLMIQGHLDQIIVNKLPRSMCLPSVVVHKITSYYPDFLPKSSLPEPTDWQHPSVQKFKAGDETYLFLSQKLLAQRVHEEKEENKEALQNRDEVNAYIHSEQSGQGDKRRTFAAEELRSHPRKTLGAEFGFEKNLVDTWLASSVRLSAYLSYHTHEERSHQQEPGKDKYQSSHLSEERLLELCDTVPRVEEVLHILHDERKSLTRQQMRDIAQQYQVTPVKLAKLCAMFPKIQYIAESTVQEEYSESDLSPVLSVFEGDAEGNEPEHVQKPSGHLQKKESEVLEHLQASACLMPEPSISRWIQLLHEWYQLTESRAIRYAANQLHTPTCRLSKFRSYYQFED